MTPTHRPRRRSGFGALTLGLTLVLAGSGPALAASPQPSPGTTVTQVDLPINPTAIVQISVEGLLRTGEPFSGEGFGVIVDPTGLILAPANLVAPDAPGVAVRYTDWELPAGVTTITVHTVPTQGQPASATFTGRVLAADGYLDLAIVGLESPGVTFAAAPLSTATRTIGERVVVVDAGSLVTGGLIEPAAYAATISETGPNVRIPTDPAWLSTDLVPPDELTAGQLLITDESGSLVALPAFNPWFSPPAVAWGWVPSLTTPLIDAARAGSTYTTPYVVAGTGNESYTFNGWTAPDPCTASVPGVTQTYPEGTAQITAHFNGADMTEGEDVVNVWWDPVERTLDAIGSFQWTGPGEGCVSSSLNAGEDSSLPNREYALTVFVGGTLRQVASERTEVKADVPAGSINVTGRVVDADTGQPIEFAFVVVLKQGVDLGTWFNNPDDTQVAANAITDEDGAYQTEPAIAPGVYPFLIQAFGYQPVGGNLDITQGGFLADIALTSLE